jgi:hypothetical protein
MGHYGKTALAINASEWVIVVQSQFSNFSAISWWAINAKMKTFVQYYLKNVHTRKASINSVVLKNYSLTYFIIQCFNHLTLYFSVIFEFLFFKYWWNCLSIIQLELRSTAVFGFFTLLWDQLRWLLMIKSWL